MHEIRKKCMAIKIVAACGYQNVDWIKRGNLKLTNKKLQKYSLKNLNDKLIQILPRACKS